MLRLLSLVVLGSTAAVGVAVARHPAAVPMAPVGASASCPLSESAQQKASDAWNAMMPTFRHPRCSNCHGGVDPFSGDGGHLGGEMPLIMVPPAGTGRKPFMDVEKTFAQCEECHGGLPGWRVPHPVNHFVEKSDARICGDLKSALGSPARFLEHMEHDDGDVKFIAESFRGTRGLNERGRENFEAEAGRPYRPEPPPISHATLLEQARAWTDQFDGGWPSDMSFLCGCVPLRYELRFDSEVTMDGDGMKVTEHVSFTAPLSALPGSPDGAIMQGAGALRSTSLKVEIPPCRVEATARGDTARVVELTREDPEDASSLIVSIWPGSTTMNMTMHCPQGSAAAPPSPGMWAPTWYALHDEEITNGVARFDGWEGLFGCLEAGCAKAIARKEIERSGTCEDYKCTARTRIEVWEIAEGEPAAGSEGGGEASAAARPGLFGLARRGRGG
ncbi:MAG TPA: hypothetical protein VMK65_05440 [Longimicrobiales bacterium]|nr:hypothetical protein [Longimicrobiales bacterium]